MKFFNLFFLLFLGVGIISSTSILAQTTPNSSDSNILIYSSSHKIDNIVEKKSGILKISIRSLYPVETVEVNGMPHLTDTDTQVELSIPYEISGDALNMSIAAFTAKGETSKTFKFSYKEKKSTTKFNLLSMLEYAQVDNVNSVADSGDAEDATKYILTLVPIYNIHLDKTSKVQVRGIFYREKYVDSDHESKEVSYTQLMGKWTKKQLLADTFTIGLGYNDIRTDNSNLSIGEYEVSTQSFLFSEISQKLFTDVKWDTKVEYKLIDSDTEPTNSNYEEDAQELAVETGISTKLGVDINANLGWTLSDAKGKYKDYTQLRYTVGASYGMGDFKPSLKYDLKQKAMKESDPNYDKKRSDNITSITASLKYNFTKALSTKFKYKHKDQDSNVDASDYKNNLMSLTLSYLY